VKIELRVLSEEEWAADEARHQVWLAQQEALADEHDQKVQLCVWARGGHTWHLDLDPSDDSITLRCLHCPAGIDDLCSDGHDLMVGEFEVYPGYVLSLHLGEVWVNDKPREGFMFGWRGPVMAVLHVEKYTSMDWIGFEYDVWVEVDPL
jgi:hypothetical protein